MGADLSGLNRGLATSKSKLNAALGTMRTAALGIATAVGGALVGIGAKAVNVAADFESQMATLGIAAKSSGLSFDDLKAAAIAVGGDITLLGVSASGSADAMTNLFKAGLTSGEIFGDLQGYMAGTAELGGALRASIDLAAATTLDMAQASELAAITLATFGGELETEAERAAFIEEAMNNLVQAADASVAEVDGLAQALSFVGSTAFNAGYSIQETNNALAILSTAGLDAGRAGRNLQSMLTSLMDPTEQAMGEFKKMGISIYDTEGNMRSIRDIIGQFNIALADMTQKERDAALGTIFTNAGIRAMLPLLNSGTEGWDDMAEATANAAGIQEQAAAKTNTFKGQMEALEGTVETLMIQIGDALLPTLTEFTQWAMQMVDEHGPAVIAFIEKAVTWFGENLPKAIAAMGVIWDQILVPAFEGLTDLLGPVLIPALAALGIALAIPLLPIALLVAALIALGLLWNEYGVEVTRILNQLGAIIGHFFGQAIGWVQGLIEGLLSLGSIGQTVLGGLGISPDFIDNLERARTAMQEWSAERANAALGGDQGNQTNQNMTIYGGLQAYGTPNAEEMIRQLWEMSQT